jgi:hypothetical protein
MGESSLFMAGKLSKPETLETSTDNTSVPKVQIKKDKSEAEKPWVGTVALHNLNKRNEQRNKAAQTELLVPEVPEVPIVQSVPEVSMKAEVFPIAPNKDFHKVSNSINRMALEGGMFTRPSCKHVYDALYLLTRGAVQPSRTVQIGRKLLQKKAGIGSDKTLDAAIASLQQEKLLRVHVAFGNQKGNVYEVFLPEEISVERSNPEISLSLSTNGTVGTNSTNSTVGYFPPNVPLVESTKGTDSQTIENKDTYSSAKTSLKTIEKSDDEAFAAMLKIFKEMSEKISGKGSNESQKENWQQLAELLKMELEIAAARTKSVSNVPAFLTEHLRRRLLGKSASTKAAEVNSKTSKSLKVGKSSGTETVEEYQAEPLTEEGREAVLKTMQEYIGKGQAEFVMSQQDSYITDDWEWLTEKLKQGDSNKQL